MTCADAIEMMMAARRLFDRNGVYYRDKMFQKSPMMSRKITRLKMALIGACVVKGLV